MSLLSNALTTVARASAFIGISTPASSSTAEILLENQINAVTSFIENYLGYTVKKTDYTNEEYTTERGQYLGLSNFPVISGETFTLQRRNSGLNEDEWETVDSQYYHVDEEGGIIYGAGGWAFPRTRNGFRVTYTAGYDYDNSTTYLSDTSGASIELAAWLLVASINGRGQGGAGIKSESIGDYRIVYAKSMFENADIESLLDKYVRLDMEIGAPLTPLEL